MLAVRLKLFCSYRHREEAAKVSVLMITIAIALMLE